MRTAVKVLGFVIAAVLVVAAGGVSYLMLAYPAVGAAPDVTAPSTPEAIARGQYLADHVSMCTDCHTPRDWSRFAGPIRADQYGAGGEIFDESMGLPGTIVSRNITPAALGTWTDGEILRAFTEGVSKDGTALFPLMPYHAYGRMDRDDALAIVAYLRTIPPIPSQLPERSLNFPLPLVVRTMPTPAQFAPRPDPANRLAYGEYMVKISGCAECHTPVDESMAPILTRALSGGQAFELPGGAIARSSNLTPHETGIGTWTGDQFIERFTRFTDATAHTPVQEGDVNTIMPWGNYAGMTREDLSAIYAYLRTIPAIGNRVVTMQAGR